LSALRRVGLRSRLPAASGSKGNLPDVKGMRKQNFLGRMNEEIPMKKTRFTEAQIMGVLGSTKDQTS